MVFFLEQRALARHGEVYERTRAIASVGGLIACADGEMSEVELDVLAAALPPLAASRGVEIAPLDRALVQVIGRTMECRIREEGESLVFDTLRPLLDDRSGAVAIALAARVAAADGHVDADELALIRPMALQLGLDPAMTNALLAGVVRGAPAARLN